MKPIKKIISDALSNKEEPDPAGRELNPEVQAFLKNEIQDQLRRFVEESILPEIRRAVAETLRAELQKLQLPTVSTFIQETAPEIEQAFQQELPLVLEEEVLPLFEERVSEEAEQLEPVPSKPKPQLSEKDIRIGIDFGTSTTAISVRIGDEQPQALPIGKDGMTLYMPSVAYFHPGGGDLASRVIVGEDAEAMNDETRVIRSVKRCFGCQGRSCASQTPESKTKFPWCAGDGNIRVSETESVPPSTIAHFILREALNRAARILQDRYGFDLNESNISRIPVNLGCGANFDLQKREIVFEAAKSIGFDTVGIKNIVEEPVLAGFAFSRFAEELEGRSLIYDFGGGTLDIAVVDVRRRQGKPVVTVLATAGENWLGGDDIDQLVYREFIDQIAENLRLSSDEVKKRLTVIDNIRIRQRAKLAKERLSSSLVFEDALLLEQMGIVALSLNRNKFESLLLNSGLISQSMDAMLRALKLAYVLDTAKEADLLDVSKIHKLKLGEAARNVDRVVLVGGVTKIPFIRRELARVFGDQKLVEEKIFEPISAVAVGAGYPKEAEHFSISSPPFEFYLAYRAAKSGGEIRYEPLIAPFQHLEFYKMVHASSVPSYCVHFTVRSEYHNPVLMGKDVGSSHPAKIKELINLKPGNYQFHVGLDGLLILVDRDAKPIPLGKHPFTHPLQTAIIDNRKERYDREARKTQNKSRRDDFIDLMSSN